MSKLPRYQSHKIVRALQIVSIGEVSRIDGSVGLSFVRDYPRIRVAAEVVARYMPKPMDYYVVYDDEYPSISPRDVFEAGYTEIPSDA